MPENVDFAKFERYKAPVLLLLIAASIIIAAAYNLFGPIFFEHVHVFYVPAIIAGLWYGRRSLYIAVLLSIIDILLNLLLSGEVTPVLFLDSFMLIVVTVIVGVLSEYQEQLNRQLSESLDGYRAIFDTTGDGMVVQDASTGQVLDSNEAWTRLSGYNRDESRALSLSRLGTGEPDYTEEEVREHIRKAMEEGPQLFEWQIRRKDGGITLAEVSLKKVNMNGDGRVMAVIRDIGERKKTEATLRLDEQRLVALLSLNQMTEADLQEITDFALEEGVRLTRSRIGYLAFMNEDETVLTMHSWSRSAMAECAVLNRTKEYPIVTTGLWGEAVRQRRPVITNDYATPGAWKRGCPPGHVPIRRHMNVPVFDGSRIVAVAGVGNKEEEYDESDVRQLTLLMQGMWRLIQRKRDLTALRESEAKFRVLAETTPSIIVIMNREGMVYANPAAEKATGYSREELMAMGPTKSYAMIAPDYHNSEALKDMMGRMSAGETVRYEMKVKTRSGEERWLDAAAGLLQFREDNAVLVTAFDVTARRMADEKLRASLHEKEMLLKEIHHRVKNNLQVVSSMLSLQSMNFDPGMSGIFRESQDRIRSMALIHEKLYQSSDLSRIDFGEYVQSLTAYLMRSYSSCDHTIKLNIDVVDTNGVGNILLGIDLAIPCGLIINELVSNALKYAFPGGRPGTITVSMRRDGRQYTLVVGDDGVGMPLDLDYRKTGSLGLQLVDTLNEQLEGSISMSRTAGTWFTIKFTDKK
ncbi:MAG: cyclic-di-GMP phosphodiesterase [Methanocella sp. PtaU1.Bin125]|nr:MAG: cyclic-di-GMP phosphodiesterase [Methanocella sp. PtaU1.Bin125]